jgi:hypothetical protein
MGRVVKMLAEKSVKITQCGTKAYVKYHPSGKPALVNLPYMPDDASDKLLDAIQGFVDHEVAHILFSDFKALNEAKAKGLKRIHNIIEDSYIEKRMAKHFAGSGLNLRNVGHFFLSEHIDVQLRENPASADAILLIPAVRAWGGHSAYKDYMSDKWHHMTEVTTALGDLVNEVEKCNSSWDCLTLAEKFKEKLSKPKPPKPEEDPVHEDPEEESKSEESEGPDGSGKGKGKTSVSDSIEDHDDLSEEDKDEDHRGDFHDELEEDPEVESSSEESKPKTVEEKFYPAAPTEPDPESEEEDDDRTSSKEEDYEEDHPEDDLGEDEEDLTVPELGHESDPEDDVLDADDDEEEKSAKGGSEPEDSGEEESLEDESAKAMPGLSGGAVTPGSSLLDELEEKMNAMDFDDALSEMISKLASDESETSDYTIYTKDQDRIEPLVIHSLDERHVLAMQEKVDSLVAPLQKDLERAVAAKSAATWSAGHKSGKLHTSSLSRLVAFNDTRVFRRKEESMTKDTAVTLLVDCSGSMSGSKIETAAYAAYGLSSVLERMNINNEVLGFTTAEHIRMDSREDGEFSRLETLYIPILKAFNERLSSENKRRFAALPIKVDLANNVDGESLQVAAERLAKRKEKRKILIVLSDGYPCAYGDSKAINKHLKKVVKEIESSGIDVLGIGIQSKSVETFYSKNVVLDSVADLPTAVIGKVKQLLMK